MMTGEETLVGDKLVKNEILKKLYWARVLATLNKIPSSVFRHHDIFGDMTTTNDLMNTLKYKTKSFDTVMDKDMLLKELMGKHFMTVDKDLMGKKIFNIVSLLT